MNNVYQLIAQVSAEVSKHGIAKDRNNQAQGYKFRGIDDVYNALSPIMSGAGLVILPRITSREVSERKNAKGSVLFYVTVEAEFDFVSSHDGSKHTVKTYGEAMDSGDKATNKAMSAAYKYAALQTFCIPTEGDNDAEDYSHQVVPDRVGEFEDRWLQVLRDASMKGLDELRSTFEKIPASSEKEAFWLQHNKSLKAAAKKASEVAA